MWYLITAAICVAIILLQNRTRKGKPLKHIILSIVLPPLGFGLWQAEKPLLVGEKRYGGKGWNTAKWFALFHSIMCLIWMIYGFVLGAQMASQSTSDAHAAGAAIGTGLAIFLIGGVWAAGFIISIIIGLVMKTPTVEEYAEPSN